MKRLFQYLIRALLVLLALQSTAALAEARPFVVEFTNAAKEVIITDEYNRTLYVFDNDLNKPASVCNANCETWPPYVVTAKE